MYGTTVLEQRCIFHKLRNVADKCREELKGETNKETRKQLMEQASAIYQAESPEEAQQRLTAFAQQWRARTRHPPWRPWSAILSRRSPIMPSMG